VLSGQSAIIDKGLVLEHTGVKGNIIVLAPATEGMKKEDGILVALFDELFTGVLEQKHVTIMKGVTHLEAIDGVGTAGCDLLNNLTRGESVLVHAIVEGNSLEEASALRGNEPVTLGHNSLSLGVLGGEGTESTRADFLFSVFVEGRLVHNSEDLFASDS